MPLYTSYARIHIEISAPEAVFVASRRLNPIQQNTVHLPLQGGCTQVRRKHRKGKRWHSHQNNSRSGAGAVATATMKAATARGMERDARGVAMVRGVWSPCNLTLFRGGWQKIVAQIRGVFRKMIPDYPPEGLENTFSHPLFVFTPWSRAPVCSPSTTLCSPSTY